MKTSTALQLNSLMHPELWVGELIENDKKVLELVVFSPDALGVKVTSSNTQRFCTLVRGYAKIARQSLIFVGDFTPFLKEHDHTWDTLKTDYESVFQEVLSSKILCLNFKLTSNELWAVLTAEYTDDEFREYAHQTPISVSDRISIRKNIRDRFRTQWASYVKDCYESGDITLF